MKTYRVVYDTGQGGGNPGDPTVVEVRAESAASAAFRAGIMVGEAVAKKSAPHPATLRLTGVLAVEYERTPANTRPDRGDQIG